MNAVSELARSFAGRRVFLTGHTGFKGSWLSAWLNCLDCRVAGYALPCQERSHFSQSQIVQDLVAHHLADIRQSTSLSEAMSAAEPDLVIHMAAQSLVRRSYSDPVETWSTNVMGTVSVLEAVRKCPSVKAVLVITTDKCYQNQEWNWGYRETDPLGGRDPYSASKGGTELVVQSYRQSFYADGGPLLASARAGNVIGGGDWSEDRLIPDAARAVIGRKTLSVRNPGSTRPWQHVLDCLSGYLTLSARLMNGESEHATAYNFGPPATDNLPVADLLSRLKSVWPELDWRTEAREDSAQLHESNFLYLDSSKARQQLDWAPRWGIDDALRVTSQWYRAVIQDANRAREITLRQIEEYSE